MEMRRLEWTHPEEPAEVPTRHLPPGALPGTSQWEETQTQTLQYIYNGGVSHSLSSSLGMPLDILGRDGKHCCGGGPSGITADTMTEAPRAKKNGWTYEENDGVSSHLAVTHWHSLRHLLKRFIEIRSNVLLIWFLELLQQFESKMKTVSASEE